MVTLKLPVTPERLAVADFQCALYRGSFSAARDILEAFPPRFGHLLDLHANRDGLFEELCSH